MIIFKIAAAQVPSIRGDVDGNIRTHAAAIAAAAKHGVNVLVFPELSLTGYEPDLAAELAMTTEDRRLVPLLELAQRHQVIAVVGAPVQTGASKPAIGAILIDASGSPKTYCKMHLGGHERRYFSRGEAPLTFSAAGYNVGIAICADTSQPSHPKAYADDGASIYAAGVFLNAEWYVTDAPRLAGYAAHHQMLTIMANHAASVGTYVSVGKSSAWAPNGALLAQTNGAENSLLIATRSSVGWQGEIIRI